MKTASRLGSLEARAERRRAWVALIAHGGAVSETWPYGKLADFRHALLRADPLHFPVEGLSAKRAALGFRELAGAFAGVEVSTARRAILAPAVAAAAKALDELLHEDARALAARAWGHFD